MEFPELSEHAECHTTREGETMCSPTIPGIPQYLVKSYLLYIEVFCLSVTFPLTYCEPVQTEDGRDVPTVGPMVVIVLHYVKGHNVAIVCILTRRHCYNF